MKEKKEKAGKLGRDGELLVRHHLMKEGFEVREWNWKPKGSHLEVDVIARRGNVIAFVEVKTRTADVVEEAVEAVDRRKILHMVKAADMYLRQQPHDFEYRFDIAAVITEADGSLRLEYFEDAFLPPLTGR